MSTSKKTNHAKLGAFEPENTLLQEAQDWLTRCHGRIEEKIERDLSHLRAAGADYGDFIDHLLELIMAVEESDRANAAAMSKPGSKITATRLHRRGTNLLSLKVLIE